MLLGEAYVINEAEPVKVWFTGGVIGVVSIGVGMAVEMGTVELTDGRRVGLAVGILIWGALFSC